MSRYNSKYYSDKRLRDLPFECGAPKIFSDGKCTSRVKNQGDKCGHHIKDGRRK